jgi:hypothetical protein|eukprot:SAG25_NODE_1215_length_3590_cov_6.991979_3_plen_229_part_00
MTQAVQPTGGATARSRDARMHHLHRKHVRRGVEGLRQDLREVEAQTEAIHRQTEKVVAAIQALEDEQEGSDSGVEQLRAALSDRNSEADHLREMLHRARSQQHVFSDGLSPGWVRPGHAAQGQSTGEPDAEGRGGEVGATQHDASGSVQQKPMVALAHADATPQAGVAATSPKLPAAQSRGAAEAAEGQSALRGSAAPASVGAYLRAVLAVLLAALVAYYWSGIQQTD